jgi:prepilin-type N-terminal cleavage/methylation domain-containing protein
MIHQHQTNQQQSGFTLIELSIVLIIIGLLVGGILVGQDLIRAGEIRATISQYEKYNTATNTFRNKYNGLPGDLTLSNVAAFGLCPAAGCPSAFTRGRGDGNGRLEDTQAIAGANTNSPDGEILIFWQQLSRANLVDGAFGNDITNTYAIGASPSVDKYFPQAKLGRGVYWGVGSSNASRNFYSLIKTSDLTTSSITRSNNGITPVEAFNIDSKIDDGKPNTGLIQARSVLSDMTPYFDAVNVVNAAAFGDDPALGIVTVNACIAGVGAGATNVNLGNNYMLYSGSDAPAGNSPACALSLAFN